MSEPLDAKEMWDALTYDQRLAATIVVFETLCEHSKFSGSFRVLIDRLGFSDDDWMDLKGAGGDMVNRMCSQYSSKADVLEEDESSTFLPPKTDSDSQPDHFDQAREIISKWPQWKKDAAMSVLPDYEKRLDELFSEAFDTNHPAMLDYAAIKLELKKLRQTQPLASCDTWTAEAPRVEYSLETLLEVYALHIEDRIRFGECAENEEMIRETKDKILLHFGPQGPLKPGV